MITINHPWRLLDDLSDDDEQKLSDYASITMNLPW